MIKALLMGRFIFYSFCNVFLPFDIYAALKLKSTAK